MSTITASLIDGNVFDAKTVNATEHWHLVNIGLNSPVEAFTRRLFEFPAIIQTLIRERDGDISSDNWFSVAVYEEPCGGQTQSGQRNHRLYVFPRNRKDQVLLITAKIGCQHDYNETVLGNCYRRYTCQKCGYSFSVDSGD